MSEIGVKDNAFISQTPITTVKFGEQCVYVGQNAFKDCTSLEEINRDNYIEDIGSNAFAGSALYDATFNYLNNIEQSAFENCSNLSYISIPKCTKIVDKTFKGCTSLATVNNPKCTSIGYMAFSSCTQLCDINLNECTDIGNAAFEDCESLYNVHIQKCKNVGNYTFANCKNMSRVSLSVCSNIGKDAFINCDKLNKVYVYNSKNNFCKLSDKYAFCIKDDSTNPPTYKINDNTYFYFKVDTIDKYKEDENWKYYIDYMKLMTLNYQIIYESINGKIEELHSDIKDNFNHSYNKYGLIEEKNASSIDMLDYIFADDSKKNITYINIPSQCKYINSSLFEGYTNLTDIVLSENLEHIGSYAFKNCESLDSFTIPESVESLGEGIFVGCKNLKKIEGKFTTYDGKAVVYNKNLICVLPKDDSETEGRYYNISEIDNTIRSLGHYCFHGCEKLIRVDIPSYIESIGSNAFDGCKNLREVHINRNVPPILQRNSNLFGDINSKVDFKIFVPESSLLDYQNHNEWKKYASYIYPKAEDSSIIYYSDKQLDTISSVIVNNECANGKYYKILNLSNTLPSNYFKNQSNVTKVILGEDITKISEKAFMGCTNLEYIYLNDNITELNKQCFDSCTSLLRIHIPNGYTETEYTTESTNNSSGDREIYNKSGVIFGDDIFSGCSNLIEFGSYYKGRVSDDNRCYVDESKTLKFFAQGELKDDEKIYTIPNNVMSIGKSAFKDSKLGVIHLNNLVTSIGEYAFANCNELTYISDWDNIKTISKGAFENCVELSEITLPNKLKTISSYAFDGCNKLKTNIPVTVTSIGSYAFRNCFTNTNIELNLVKITDINKYTFSGCTKLSKVNISNNIKQIDDSAFEGCSSLKSINLPDSLTFVGNYSFKGCTELESVSIKNTSKLEEIYDSAFEGCSKLSTISLPDSLKTIGNKTFKDCSGLSTVFISIITSKLEGIYDSAFEGCSKLTTLNLPNSLKTIGNKAFKDCTSYVWNLIIPKNLSHMGNYCFENSGINGLNTSNNVNLTSISSGAFKNCKNLNTINLNKPESQGLQSIGISNIGEQAFYNCTNLCKSNAGILTLPESIMQINDSAFENCENISEIQFPINLTALGDNCFARESAHLDIYINNSIPSFYKNGTSDESSNPFGNPTTLKNSLIIHASKLMSIYKRDKYWKKYRDYIYD